MFESTEFTIYLIAPNQPLRMLHPVVDWCSDAIWGVSAANTLYNELLSTMTKLADSLGDKAASSTFMIPARIVLHQSEVRMHWSYAAVWFAISTNAISNTLFLL